CDSVIASYIVNLFAMWSVKGKISCCHFMTVLVGVRALRDAVGGWDWVAMMVLYCQSSAVEDRDFTRRMNELLQEMVSAYDDKVDFIRELEAVLGVDTTAKTAEFLNENLWKGDKKLRKLRNMEIDASMRADQKDRFIEKL
ncbi:hypothetical protein Tco_1443642, partial [Tanacetum coccineum]